MSKVTVTLTRSLIASKPKQRATADSLGLRRIGDRIVHEDNAALAGKIQVLAHLVTVAPAEDPAPAND